MSRLRIPTNPATFLKHGTPEQQRKAAEAFAALTERHRTEQEKTNEENQ